MTAGRDVGPPAIIVELDKIIGALRDDVKRHEEAISSLNSTDKVLTAGVAALAVASFVLGLGLLIPAILH